MRLHQVRPTHKNKKTKPRVGRGGKRGTYSGKGQKGQKSRAGRKIRPAIYDLIGRLPKLRGYNNKSFKAKPLPLKLDDLKKIKGDVIDKKALVDSKLISGSELKKSWGRVKILSGGNINRAVEIKGIDVSGSAKEKIEKAGGKITR